MEFDYGPGYNAAQTRSEVFVTGVVGPQVGSVELRFEDGESVELDLLEDYFFYMVPRNRYGKGHRPTVLVARDEDGLVLSRRRMTQ
jgi:hypothetical protein